MLRHQVKVLSRKVGRVKLRRIDKVFLAACSRVLPRHRWGSFVVAPSTLLRWHRELVRRKGTYQHQRGGRPRLDPDLAALICRMARENPRWGYLRIKGECQKLGIAVAATTVKKILGAAGLEPAPRRDGPSWSEFLCAQADGIWACDFFSVETVFLRTLYVLFFIDVGSRRLHITSSTRILTGASSPNRRGTSRWMVTERLVRTVRHEVLDLTLVLGERHLDRILRRYAKHYNTRRPHRGLDLRTPDATSGRPISQEVPRVRRIDVLGGLIHEYEFLAA